MSEEGKFWVSCWTVAAITIAVMSVAAVSCNRQDNELFSKAIALKCSITVDKNGHHEIACPQK